MHIFLSYHAPCYPKQLFSHPNFNGLNDEAFSLHLLWKACVKALPLSKKIKKKQKIHLFSDSSFFLLEIFSNSKNKLSSFLSFAISKLETSKIFYFLLPLKTLCNFLLSLSSVRVCVCLCFFYPLFKSSYIKKLFSFHFC